MSENKQVLIPASLQGVQEASDQLSDILCWLEGFRAGGGSFVFSTGRVSALNAVIKQAITKAEESK